MILSRTKCYFLCSERSPKSDSSRLATPAGVDRDEKNQVHQVEEGFDRFDGGTGNECDAAGDAALRIVDVFHLGEFLEDPVDMSAGLGVNGNNVGPGADIVRDLSHRVGDHEVDVLE